MPCKHKDPPPPPENADELDRTKKPINNNCGPITFSWVRPVIRTIKKHNAMYFCDIHPLSDELKSYRCGKAIVKEWNVTAQAY